ncbi:Claudin domain-containing protein 2, partial [Galemys pyrenaicus]
SQPDTSPCELLFTAQPPLYEPVRAPLRPRRTRLTASRLTASIMEPWRTLALLAGSMGLTCMLVALSTDFWFAAVGPGGLAHSGLWPRDRTNSVNGYIRVTQSFTILSALLGLVSVGFLVLSCIPSLSAPGHGPLVSCITGFAAALCATVAMAVYTSERWRQDTKPDIQSFFSWSFHLGWVATVLLYCTGGFSLAAHRVGPAPGYESMKSHRHRTGGRRMGEEVKLQGAWAGRGAAAGAWVGQEHEEKGRLLLLALFFGVAGTPFLYSRGLSGQQEEGGGDYPGKPPPSRQTPQPASLHSRDLPGTPNTSCPFQTPQTRQRRPWSPKALMRAGLPPSRAGPPEAPHSTDVSLAPFPPLLAELNLLPRPCSGATTRSPAPIILAPSPPGFCAVSLLTQLTPQAVASLHKKESCSAPGRPSAPTDHLLDAPSSLTSSRKPWSENPDNKPLVNHMTHSRSPPTLGVFHLTRLTASRLTASIMEPWRPLALLAGSMGLTCMLVALSTDFWFVAVGPGFSAHLGLWPRDRTDSVNGYIRVTQSFTILSALLGLVSVGFLVLSCIPSLSAPGHGPLVSCITGFAAALCATVAMAVYTSERWRQDTKPDIQSFFSWSFHLGWVATVLLYCTAQMAGGEASVPSGSLRKEEGGFGFRRDPEGGGSPDSQKLGLGVALWGTEGSVERGVSQERAQPTPPLWPPGRLPGMGVKRSLQSGGTILGFLANVVTIISTASNYWIQHHGGHSGLWQECNHGACSNIPCQILWRREGRAVAEGPLSPAMLAVTGACMVLSAGCSIVGLVMAVRILCHEGNSRGQATSIVFFLCGLLLLVALTGYTAKNAWRNDVFFSWSYFSGWLALPFSILAGFCFMLADMIVQSTDAISGFPVCL